VLSPAQLASIQNASTARPLHEPARAGIVPLMLTSPARPGSRLAMLQLKALWLCQPISKVAFWAHCLQGLEERPTRVPRDAQVELAAREHCATAYGCSHSSCSPACGLEVAEYPGVGVDTRTSPLKIEVCGKRTVWS